MKAEDKDTTQYLLDYQIDHHNAEVKKYRLRLVELHNEYRKARDYGHHQLLGTIRTDIELCVQEIERRCNELDKLTASQEALAKESVNHAS